MALLPQFLWAPLFGGTPMARTTFSQRRWLAGFARRKLQWEFWPAWAAYLPIVPHLIFLAIRHRSSTVFTAANPFIPGGGLVGESKFAILQALARASADAGRFELIPAGSTGAQRLAQALDFAQRGGWPVVLKPDVGERGVGVSIVRSAGEAATYLAANSRDTIIQSYLPGVEFGIFYYRFPDEPRGRIFSVTEKRFPFVTGDGRRSLRELILSDRRAVCAAAAYLRAAKRNVDQSPAEGEQVQLVEIGSHCRGAIFLDGSRHVTSALEQAVDQISCALPGFYFGRFDVRSDSIEDLRAGRFRVIELNGVAAEAAHIYDPAVSIGEAYRTMRKQWELAFAIGAANRARGFKPASLREVLVSISKQRRAEVL